MTDKQIKKEFYSLYGGFYLMMDKYKQDKCKVRQEFSFFIDNLHRDGLITDYQVNNIIL